MPRTNILAIQSQQKVDGFIRFGEKTGSGTRALAKPRLTSNDRVLLEQAAQLYGGTVRPWKDGEQAFELYVDVEEIAVWMPPQDILGGACYEVWGGGLCKKRCLGGDERDACTDFNPDGSVSKGPCTCDEENPKPTDCKLVMRYWFRLIGLTSMGRWRLITHSYHARKEWPGLLGEMFEMFPQGFFAVIGTDRREKVVRENGKPLTKKFPVPSLRFRPGIADGIVEKGGVLVGQMATPVLGTRTPELEQGRADYLDVDETTGEVLEPAQASGPVSYDEPDPFDGKAPASQPPAQSSLEEALPAEYVVTVEDATALAQQFDLKQEHISRLASYRGVPSLDDLRAALQAVRDNPVKLNLGNLVMRFQTLQAFVDEFNKIKGGPGR